MPFPKKKPKPEPLEEGMTDSDTIPPWRPAAPVETPERDRLGKFTAETLRKISPDARQALIDSLSEKERKSLQYWWEFWARPNQLTPPGDWLVWLVLAGRGFGKTRTGAEKVREKQEKGGCGRIALIGATADDVRSVMVEGESGILTISPPWNRPRYEPSKRRLTWPNGAMGFLYSADEPDRLRGPQHDFAWADELAAWKYAQEAWDMMTFGMRLGNNPQVVATTTPRPIPLLRDLIQDKTTHITKGSTYENATNLAPSFVKKIIAKYEGTRLGRQEIRAEILGDTPGALWTEGVLERTRVRPLGYTPFKFPILPSGAELYRIAIGVDPAGKIAEMARLAAGLASEATDEEDGDECGIVVSGKGDDGHGYVLEDCTTDGSPYVWGEAVVDAYVRWSADVVTVEKNHGGDAAKKVIEAVAKNRGIPINVEEVWASKGKHTRAEPISSLYEQGLIHHVGQHEDLEDELTQWVPGQRSPNRLDALVFSQTELMVDSEDDGGAVLGGQPFIHVPVIGGY